MLGTLLVFLALFYPEEAHKNNQPPVAESYITWANLEARVHEGNHTVEVKIEYQLNKRPGTRSLSYEGIETFETRFEQVVATFDSQSISLEPSKESIKISGKIELPEEHVRDSTITFVIKYNIAHANLVDQQKFNVNIPILWIEQARGRSDKHLFQAHLALPEQYYLKESFPSITGECINPSKKNDACLSLQVLPTFLRIRGLVGHNPILTPLQALDLSIVSLLVGTCAAVLLLLVKKNRVHKHPV